MKNIIIAASLSLACISAQADTWNMATPYGEGYFQTQNVHAFAKEINEKTEGALKITVHSGASLYKSPEIFKAVRSGQVEMGELLMANLGNDNALFKVDNIPFLATSYPAALKLWEASKAEISTALEAKGAILLYAVPWPPQNFYSKEPIADAEYFKGRKLRSYNATTSSMASLLGASPTTIQVPEIPQAFSTGTIDAMITSGATGVSSQAWDFVKHYTEVNAWLPKNMVFINKKKWRKLDQDTQKIILAAAENAEKRGWELSQKANADDKQTLADNGMTIHAASDALSSGLSTIGKSMTTSWKQDAGEVGEQVLNAFQQ